MTRATSTTSQRELTFQEYMATPAVMRRQEVIDGVIVVSPVPTVHHQFILTNVVELISPHVRLHNVGTVIPAPADLVIRKTPKLQVRQPDLMFFSCQRASRETLKKLKIIEITPDIAMEIISPSDRPTRWTGKLADYASVQVPELWRIDSKTETVEIHALVEGRYSLQRRSEAASTVESRFLPGLALPVGALFE
jgi:Uma2 family endonuclease